MIAESLHHTIKLIETTQKVSPSEDKKLEQALCYLVQHMKLVEAKLNKQG